MLRFVKSKKLYQTLGLLFLLTLLFYYFVVQSSLSYSEKIDQQSKLINQNNLEKHVIKLSEIGSRLSIKSKKVHYDESKRDLKISYISKELKSYGYEITKEEFQAASKFDLPPMTGINLFVTKVGNKWPKKIIEVGAHYDTRTDSPGADDNSSGISALLEFARNLKNIQTEKTIRICFFDLEEFGLFGSREHVRLIKLNKKETVEEIIVLEMIGFASDKENSQETPIRIPLFVDPPKKGNFISFVGNWQSRAIAYEFEDATQLYGKVPHFGLKIIGGFLKDSSRSDHYPYWQSNYKAIMITDTANFRNHHYHQKTDIPSTLNYTFMHKVSISAYALLLHRAIHK